MIVGEVTFEFEGRKVTGTLHSDGAWFAVRDEVAKLLDRDYPKGRFEFGPEAGHPAAAHLFKTAEALKGKARLLMKIRTSEHEVY